MKLLLICLFLVYISRPSCGKFNDYVDTFEFGQNFGRIAYSTSGSFGMNDKQKREHITIPQCSKLVYVRVDVNSQYGPPLVNFDWKTHTVIIDHDTYQFRTTSQYSIIAKTVPSYCDSQPSGQNAVWGIGNQNKLWD